MRKLTALLLTSVLSAAAAAQVPSAEADLDLITRVKTALAAHADTRPLPLTVSISDGVVAIGGPVPLMGLESSIQAAVKNVPGMGPLRVTCWVPSAEDPLAAAVKAKLKTTSAPSPVMEPKPAPKVDVPDFARTTPLPQLSPAQPIHAARDTYSPVPPPAPPAPNGPPDGETIPPPRVPVTPKQDVAAALDAVQRRDHRYAKLTVAAKLGVVTISGPDAEAAWDLAAEIRRVPGVERVIVARPSR